ncbi:hypothetical protein [Microbulbifer pacificus]|uniref:Lipoprotein n=1 Tax=Microbulbifer pacificus TaxID=407164 RepID=A0AAU0MYP6_9GAMM|nr:hypothetical protein [Microbulbifer pacificus]WOX05827.1 hypothetical protein R5R33_01370 [Microbulbifer pacificus]
MMSWIAAAAISISSCSAPEEVVTTAVVTGVAQTTHSTSGSSGELRYCEYFLVDDSGNVRVLYYDPVGQKIAEKRLSLPQDSSSNSMAGEVRPEVIQEDFRRGEIREVSREGDNWRIRYRNSAQGRWQDSVVPDVNVDVVDAGFDAFVREHWGRLTSGETVEFDFVSPVHGQSVRLRARAVVCDGSMTASDHVCLNVDLAQPWLRWLAGDLLLTYSSRDRRLQYFRGIVNLHDERGKAQKLSIRYFYR